MVSQKEDSSFNDSAFIVFVTYDWKVYQSEVREAEEKVQEKPNKNVK